MEKQTYYIHKIKEALSQKQRQNPQFSVRAYSKYLGVHPATMNQVIKGTRNLPLKNSDMVMNKLNLSPKERTLFLESLLKSKVRLDNIKIHEEDSRFMLDESYHKIISEWEHYVVLDLFDLDSFNPTVENIARKLKINENRANVVVTNLLTAGLLNLQEDKTLKKIYEHINTTEDIMSQALKDSHKETLNMGIEKLEDINVELRDFSAMTIAVDLDKLKEAKAIIREFRQKMKALLRNGEKTDVYQLAIQFYPMTKIENKLIN